MLTHIFTLRRDERTYARGVYEKLYAPVIFDALLFLDAHTHYTAGHDVVPGSVDRLLERVVSHVGEHLSLASPRMIAAFYDTRRHRFIDDDMVGYGQALALRRFLSTLVEEFAHTAGKLGFLESVQRREIAWYVVLYRIWVVVTRLYRDERSNTLLRHAWLLEQSRMGLRFRRELARWEAKTSHMGEGWDSMAQEFELFIIRAAGRDEEARLTLREAVAQDHRPRS